MTQAMTQAMTQGSSAQATAVTFIGLQLVEMQGTSKQLMLTTVIYAEVPQDDDPMSQTSCGGYVLAH